MKSETIEKRNIKKRNIKNGFYIFHVGQYKELDHLAPIIFTFLKKGHNVKLLIITNFKYKDDYRIRFFSNFETFKVERVSFFQWLRRKIFFSNKATEFRKKYFLIRTFVNFILKFWNNIYINQNTIALLYGWNQPTLLNCEEGLKKNIPLIALPHGLSIFREEVGPVIKNIFLDRSKFAAYITVSERHRRQLIYQGIDKNKVFALGSLRFEPYWIIKNKNLTRIYGKQNNLNGNALNKKNKKKKFLFLMPHYDYKIDKGEIKSLLTYLLSDNDIQVKVKIHSSDTQNLKFKKDFMYYFKKNKDVFSNLDSITLINWADVIIANQNSVLFDALILKKLILYCDYLDSYKTIFDNEKVVTNISDFKQLYSIIQKLKKDQKISLPKQKDLNKIFLKEVYTNKDKINIREVYYKFIRNISQFYLPK